MSDLKNIQNDYSAKLNNNLSLEEINQIKTELFGKNGLISSQFKNIASIPSSLWYFCSYLFRITLFETQTSAF